MRGRVWLALGVVLLVAGGAAVLVPVVRAATSDPPPTTEQLKLYSCAHRPGDDYCQRITDDRAARAELTAAEREAADGFTERLRAAFETGLGGQCRPEIRSCRFETPPTAGGLRAALTEAGFSGPVVRETRLYDPAPFGAIVYAVRAGSACLVGYIESSFSSTIEAVGRLRDGSCLPP